MRVSLESSSQGSEEPLMGYALISFPAQASRCEYVYELKKLAPAPGEPQSRKRRKLDEGSQVVMGHPPEPKPRA